MERDEQVVIDEDLGGFLPAGHAMVLGMTAAGAPLDATLKAVAELLEMEIPDCHASIMLLDAAGLLKVAAAPSLPLGYVHALSSGVPVGPDVGSCGAAVHSGRPAVVRDVATSKSWRGFADIAVANGLQACWSVPIAGEGGQPIGAFGMYYEQPREPSAVQIQRLGGYAQLVAVAVQRDEAKRELTRARGTDALTGLPTADHLPSTLGEALERCRYDQDEWVAVTAVEVGRLQDCTQALGYAAGDELVRLVTGRITATVGDAAHVFRTGGGAFTVIARGRRDEDPQQLPGRILRALSAPFTIAGVGFTDDPAAGLAVSREAGSDVDALMAEAMSAVEHARHSTGSQLLTAGAVAPGQAAARLTVENDLRRAFKTSAMVLHYQPQFRLDSGVLVGVEALVRWQHPERGLLPPAEFLPAVDSGRLHAELTRLVLSQACRDATTWRQDHSETPFTVAVNLSGSELHDLRVVSTVRDALEESGLPGAALCVEVTEQAALLDLATAAATLQQLKSLGVKLAIDDFGTGYSSLSYARRFPIDYLKVDGSFVHHVDTDPDDAAVVAAVVGLADGLGVDVLAEGIETIEHLRVLRDLGCQAGQGFLWSPAVPREQIDDLLAAPVPLTLEDAGGGERRAAARWHPDADDVLAHVVHEARQPLTAVQLQVDRLPEMKDEQTRVQTSLMMSRQLAALDGILRAAGETRDLDRGALTLDLSPVDLASVVRQVVDDMTQTMSRRMHLELVPCARVLGDVARFQQILVNLLSNADQHSPPQSVITVRTTVDADTQTAHVVVEDRGPGVPPDKTGLIFRKYGRADEQSSGLGLGLYISRQLARSHGGDLSYRHARPRGAIFDLTLPLHIDEPA